jgi:hypothetical protein
MADGGKGIVMPNLLRIGIQSVMGAWYDDVWEGFQKPFKFAYNQGERVVGLGDKILDAAGHAATGLGGAIEGLGSLLSGNSNILLYLGLGIVGVIVLPKVLEKVL